MARNFGLERHRGLSPAFDLAPWSYFLDFVLVPIAAIVLVSLAARDLRIVGIGGLILFGIVAWSLAEYWIHRLVFHGSTRFEAMHQLHHALPKDMIGVASWGTFAGFAGIWLIAALVGGCAAGSAFTSGVMGGYLFYCGIHVRFHHHRPGARLGRYVAFMNAHHAGHHRGGKGNFGVSSPIWDFVFCTYRKSSKNFARRADMIEASIKLRFVRSKGFESDAIAWREKTCMPFTPSHTECVTPDGKWLGQHIDGGMQAREPGYDHDDVAIMDDGRRCEIIVGLPCTQAQADAFYAAATASIGEPYDWKAIVGFAVTFHEHQKFHAICSAKMLLLLRTPGCEYFRWPTTVPAHLVDPRDLLFTLSTHVEIPH